MLSLFISFFYPWIAYFFWSHSNVPWTLYSFSLNLRSENCLMYSNLSSPELQLLLTLLHRQLWNNFPEDSVSSWETCGPSAAPRRGAGGGGLCAWMTAVGWLQMSRTLFPRRNKTLKEKKHFFPPLFKFSSLPLKAGSSQANTSI